MTSVDGDDIKFKITFQHCNVYVRCDGKSGELILIKFIRTGMATIGI